MAETQKGQAVLWGVGTSGAVEVGAYALVSAESAKAAHKFAMDAVEDENGFDAALVATNEFVEADVTIYPQDGANVGVALEPFATVALSGFSNGELNGSWIYMGDASLDLSHKAAKFSLKLRRYVQGNIT